MSALAAPPGERLPVELSGQREGDREGQLGDTAVGDLLIVDAGGRRHALRLQDVVEVARVPPLAKLPHVPTYLKGCAQVRNEVIPVIELAGRLGLVAGPQDAPAAPRARVLLVRSGHGRAGLLVSGVVGVWRGPALSDGRPQSDSVAGERLPTLLDLERIVDWRAG